MDQKRTDEQKNVRALTWQKVAEIGYLVSNKDGVFTIVDLHRELDIDRSKTKRLANRLSVMLSYMVRHKKLVRVTKGAYMVSRQLVEQMESDPVGPRPKLVAPAPQPESLSLVDIGEAVISVVDKLKGKIKALNETITDLTDKNLELENLYRKAQEKILELNQKCMEAGKGQKRISLADLQNLRNGG